MLGPPTGSTGQSPTALQPRLPPQPPSASRLRSTALPRRPAPLRVQALKELTTSKGAAVIDFTAKWCGPCKMIAPIYEELAAEFEGKVRPA